MNIDGSDFEDEMLEDEPEEEVLFIGGSEEPVLEELQTTEYVEDVVVEDEPELTKEEQRMALYNTLAEKMPLVQEVVGGYTTFREALDEIVYELGHPGDESEGIAQFTEYFTALALLSGELTIDAKGMMDVIRHNVNNSPEIKRLLKAITIGGGITFGGSLGVGFAIERWYPEIGYVLKMTGASGLGATGTARGAIGVQNWFQKRKANKRFASLYDVADMLDTEVAELYRTEE